MRTRLIAVLIAAGFYTAGLAQVRSWHPDEHKGAEKLLITATPETVAVKVAPGLVFQHFKYALRMRAGYNATVEVWEVATFRAPDRKLVPEGAATVPEFYEYVWHEFDAATYFPAPKDKTVKESISVRSNGNRGYLITVYRYEEH